MFDLILNILIKNIKMNSQTLIDDQILSKEKESNSIQFITSNLIKSSQQNHQNQNDQFENSISTENLNSNLNHQSTNPATPTRTNIELDPFLSLIDQSIITTTTSTTSTTTNQNQNQNQNQQNQNSIITTSTNNQLNQINLKLTPNSIPRLPKTKLIQSNQLNHAAQRALNAVWDTLQSANTSHPPQLEISRNLDCLLGELHGQSFSFLKN